MQPDSEAIDTSELPWRPSPYEGVEWKKLHHDPQTGLSAVLLRFAPGASYGTHRHPEGLTTLPGSNLSPSSRHTFLPNTISVDHKA